MWLLLDPEQNAADLLQLKPDLVKELHQTETSATIAIVKARYVLRCNRERDTEIVTALFKVFFESAKLEY